MDEKQFFDKARKVAKNIDQGAYMGNAYELAKELKEDTCIQIGSLKPKELAEVLIQMADRIAELERKLKEEFDYVERLLKDRNQ